eukprot:595052-Hanusia_phi.AAC.1
MLPTVEIEEPSDEGDVRQEQQQVRKRSCTSNVTRAQLTVQNPEEVAEKTWESHQHRLSQGGGIAL